MKAKLFVSVLLLFSLLMHVSAQEKENGWTKIGTKVVNFKPETDEISVKKKDQGISKLKLECIKGTAKLKQIVVTYDDGSQETLKPKGGGILTKGTSSLAWSLAKEKNVKSFTFSYDAVGNVLLTDRGKLEIWVKKKE